jgi:hypothetical protein
MRKWAPEPPLVMRFPMRTTSHGRSHGEFSIFFLDKPNRRSIVRGC